MAEFAVDPRAIQKVTRSSPEYREKSRIIAQKILDTAVAVFLSRDKHEDTPPFIYPERFKLEWHQDTLSWRIINDDPIWNLVEYGAHPGGGNTFVLKYRPLGTALDIVAGGHQ